MATALDADRRMDVDALDRILLDLRAQSVPVIAVVAVAGSTPVGAFDPLQEIHEVCRRHDVWLHVDAAHGGGVVFSDRHRLLAEGLHLADSVVMDAHKMLFMPALCAFVFYKNKADRYCAFQQSAPYLFDPSAPDMAEYDNGVVTLECTKRAAALGLWGVWSMFSPQLFAAMVDKVFSVAQAYYELLREHPDFVPFAQPVSNILVFRYLPRELSSSDPEQIDALQLGLRRNINRNGKAYLTQTVIDGRAYLRSTIMNPMTERVHLEKIIREMSAVGTGIGVEALNRCGATARGDA